MAELLTAPARQVDRGYFKETHAQIASHSKLLSDAVGESTPPLIDFRFSGRRRFVSGKRGWGAHRAFSSSDELTTVSVGYAGPVVEPNSSIDAKRKLNPTFGIRIGDSDQVYRKAKHIEEHLGGRAVHDAGLILYELARQEGRLSKTTLLKADTVLDIASVAQTHDTQRNATVFLPDSASGKVVQVTRHGESLPEDIMGRKLLIDRAKGVVGSVRHIMKEIPDQAISIQLIHHQGQEMISVQSANGTYGKLIPLSEVSEAEASSVSVPEQQDNIDQRDTVKIGAETVSRRFKYLRPETSEPIKNDELVAVIPGWSMPYGTKPIGKLAQEYANQGNMRALLVNARADSVVGEDDLFLRAQAIAKLIIQRGVKEVTLTGHSQGGTQAADVAYILQTMREEQILRGIEPTIPTVKGLILHDPVGLYDQNGALLAGRFLGDALMTFGEAVKEQGRDAYRRFVRRQKRPIMHDAGKGASGRALQAGNAIVAGAIQEGRESGRKYLKRTFGEISGMADVPLDRKERLAALKVPVVIITGEKDPISRPEKFVPGYETFNWQNAMIPDPDSATGGLYNVRERRLQEAFFNNAPYVRMVTARRFGHHGGPLGQPEKQAKVGRALVDRANRPELRSSEAYAAYNAEQNAEPKVSELVSSDT